MPVCRGCVPRSTNNTSERISRDRKQQQRERRGHLNRSQRLRQIACKLRRVPSTSLEYSESPDTAATAAAASGSGAGSIGPTGDSASMLASHEDTGLPISVGVGSGSIRGDDHGLARPRLTGMIPAVPPDFWASVSTELSR